MCNKRKAYSSDELVYEKRYNASLLFDFSDFESYMDAFTHPPAPILSNDNLEAISLRNWGVVPPSWKKPKEEIWNGTINAKLEYFAKRYAWKEITHQRCLVPTAEYYEHHWNDPKGRSKTLYRIKHAEEEMFSIAGLWSDWVAPDGKVLRTYTLVTTEANEIMRFVHNKDAQIDYHRMPLMLNPEDEREWLDPKNDYNEFGFPNYQPRLVAAPVELLPPPQLSLF
jgi:putative SOS response-associated peptidase YedK